MGKKFRQRRDATINSIVGTDDVVANHESLDVAVQYENEPAHLGTTQYQYDSQFPGQRELQHREAQGYTPPTIAGVGTIRDDSVSGANREANGQRGRVDIVPYSVGVVSSNLVENFDLTGQQAVIRRQANPGGVTGPVGTSDHNALLAMAYEQSVNQFYPNEASQYDLVKSV
jgi:hypothetical protein